MSARHVLHRHNNFQQRADLHRGGKIHEIDEVKTYFGWNTGQKDKAFNGLYWCVDNIANTLTFLKHNHTLIMLCS